MLSYRHGYHAGNYADVLKHSMLLQVLKAMQKKAKPFVYIDTHAGAGAYSLEDEFAQKTGEYLDGVAKLWDHDNLPAPLQDYVAAVKHFNAEYDELSVYPGSPSFVDVELRQQDRMVLHELHSTDHELLNEYFEQDKQVKVINGDGLKGLIAAVPPLERRAVVLIDPSYEIKTDYVDVANTLIKAHKKFSTGVYMLWYPVVQREQTEAMLSLLKDSGIKKQLRIEQAIGADSEQFGMTAAGLWIINPPWQTDELARETLACLAPLLGSTNGNVNVQWEVGE
ncbi:23S rRNA (adenine(2030)-N(6))-methyltransferase RlmJ [Shewanella intestini]|uniref:Ribosomal RNA large subunit methyltransferase J n=1 Tax=Shewanella intestini TaxID=2017544 RepID=A0ABS5I6H6_9GAMM|nr:MULTISPECIES: 23S rRNA (adenine(2030)-N(6))-methyltransferase RlmJ [Shewanella]MBR9729630.1 23S rRNA (adenine(2030)-N(6))-methyltransferase RlmJ [Shewanella intestini]MRG37699.1 23S rRNA (adenine(2030)-N(6))-methyltransferase RlmJ [Shewanella sp. XMDDZSB0408]